MLPNGPLRRPRRAPPPRLLRLASAASAMSSYGIDRRSDSRIKLDICVSISGRAGHRVGLAEQGRGPEADRSRRTTTWWHR